MFLTNNIRSAHAIPVASLSGATAHSPENLLKGGKYDPSPLIPVGDTGKGDNHFVSLTHDFYTGSLFLHILAGGMVKLVLEALSDRDLSDVLRVFVGDATACCAGKAPIAGQYYSEEQRLTFDPVFDVIEGQSYTVMSREEGSRAAFEATLSNFIIEPNKGYVAPEVIVIYPSGPDIPENTFRLGSDEAPCVDGLHQPCGCTRHARCRRLHDLQASVLEPRSHSFDFCDGPRTDQTEGGACGVWPRLVAGNRYAIRIENGW